MPIVQQVLARVFVDDIDQALPTYQQLSGGAVPRRFGFRDVQIAWVGFFLLLQMPAEQRGRYERVATLLVEDIDTARAAVESSGGTVLEESVDAPNGPRMIARHGDGAVFEYIQTDPA